MGSTNGQRRRPQKYPEELRERAVRMVFEVREQSGEKHGVITRVARELGVGTESLRNWVRQAEIDTGRRGGTSTADGQRIAALEKENRELRRANDILKAGRPPTDLENRDPLRFRFHTQEGRARSDRSIRDRALSRARGTPTPGRNPHWPSQRHLR